MELIPLQKLYEQYKEEFNKTGLHPNPGALLAMLLFQEIDKYKTFICADDEFYDYHKISEKVKQVIADFSITKEEIRSYDEDIINIEHLSDNDYYYEIGYSVFASGWCSLKRAIMKDDNSSPEELFDYFAKTNGWLMMPTKDKKIVKLQVLYEQYKKDFNKTGNHPHPSELLSILLLQEKDKYKPISGNSGEFYQYYKEQINEKIEQVIVDFAISKDEIIKYIEKTGIYYEEERYGEFKIWFVFVHGFSVLQWGLMYHQDYTPEQLHNAFSKYWGREEIPNYLIEETPKTHKIRKRRTIPTTTTGFKN